MLSERRAWIQASKAHTVAIRFGSPIHIRLFPLGSLLEIQLDAAIEANGGPE
jgi:hypothetical protein